MYAQSSTTDSSRRLKMRPRVKDGIKRVELMNEASTIIIIIPFTHAAQKAAKRNNKQKDRRRSEISFLMEIQFKFSHVFKAPTFWKEYFHILCRQFMSKWIDKTTT